MSQDRDQTGVSSRSGHFKRNYQPYHNISLPGSMNNCHPPVLQPTVMSPGPQNQWGQWYLRSGPMGDLMSMTSFRPSMPWRQGGPAMFQRAGPRTWRGSRFERTAHNRFNPLSKGPHRFQGPPPPKQEPTGDAAENCKSDGVGNDEPAKVSVKLDPAGVGAEKCITSEVKKRKSRLKKCPSKAWNRQDAEKALRVELEAYKNQVKTLIIRFPDPDLSWDIIRSYHKSIEKVHFLVPSGPRYCFIQLSDDSDVDQVIKELREVDFHNLGKIQVEKKCERSDGNVDPEAIDPYTLYIGNLPLTIETNIIKEKFPTARVDVGYARKMKFTRYAFLRYHTVEESIEAFKSCRNVMFDNRNLIVRFRRQDVKDTLMVDDPDSEEEEKEVDDDDDEEDDDAEVHFIGSWRSEGDKQNKDEEEEEEEEEDEEDEDEDEDEEEEKEEVDMVMDVN